MKTFTVNWLLIPQNAGAAPRAGGGGRAVGGGGRAGGRGPVRSTD